MAPGLAAFCLMICCGVAAQELPAGAVPALELRTLDGTAATLRAAPGKVTVINFWATWCIPCAEEMPWLRNLQKKYGDRVEVIAVSLDEEPAFAEVRKFVSKHKLTFPVLVGANTHHLTQLGLGEALPATAFLDTKGRVSGRVKGMLRKKKLEQRVAWMLDGKGDVPPAVENNL